MRKKEAFENCGKYSFIIPGADAEADDDFDDDADADDDDDDDAVSSPKRNCKTFLLDICALNQTEGMKFGAREKEKT